MSKEKTRGRGEKKSPLPLKKRHSKPCFFCENKVDSVDYKDIGFLTRYQSGRGKILPRRQSYCCSKHQRKISEAVKRARFMGLLPFVTDQD